MALSLRNLQMAQQPCRQKTEVKDNKCGQRRHINTSLAMNISYMQNFQKEPPPKNITHKSMY